MPKLNLRIGTKLGLSAGLGVLLVIGMVLNAQLGNNAVEKSNTAAANQNVILQNILSAESDVRRMQVVVRDMRLAPNAEAVNGTLTRLQDAEKSLNDHADAGLKLAVRQEMRDRLQKTKEVGARYVAASKDLAAAKLDAFAGAANRTKATQAWTSTLKNLTESRAFAALANHSEVESELREAGAYIQSARASSWRFSVTGDAETKKQMAGELDKAIELVQAARGLLSDKTMQSAVDNLLGAAGQFKSISLEMVNSEEKIADIVKARTLTAAAELQDLIQQAAAGAKGFAAQATTEASEEMTLVARIGFAVGLVVVFVLLGSAVYAMFGIARPLQKLNGALGEMAAGNLAITIPGIDRSDEIGDIGKTIGVIRQNAENEAVRKQEEAQRVEADRAAQRRADMLKLADQFDKAVGGIIGTVSSASTELEAAAGTLTKTAETTQQLSTTVAAASEEASVNVQSVASATNEMSSSVNEISRQVQESSKIANEAVKQAEKTDARINDLSQAAARIGDVVKLITAIAEQTNLLALNATIEAARAGEAGKGFAVVAQEVKALAAQTAKATDEIGTQISGMQTATQESVAAIKEIGGTIGRIAEIASTIAAAVEEQGAATQEIARNVQQAAQGTTQVASNITEVNRGAGETGAASSQVLTSAQSLSQESNRLKMEVDNFLNTVRAA